jgi:hypothetical protein
MQGGVSTGPRRKRDGTPSTVEKPLEWCRPGAAEITEGNLLWDSNAMVRAVDVLVRSKRKRVAFRATTLKTQKCAEPFDSD